MGYYSFVAVPEYSLHVPDRASFKHYILSVAGLSHADKKCEAIPGDCPG
ncbi:hypothetical protein LVD17_15000 [Fulvivirga ulvae]|nr:hypothetical protein [Fulvivirga ulvae]UII29607.1 hypothetical protein LVD17_15000 [Fulvivirga ulvae]